MVPIKKKSNVYSLRVHSFDKNVVLRFWKIIIKFSSTNVDRKTLYVYYMKFGC
jgi:hypothetical protein